MCFRLDPDGNQQYASIQASSKKEIQLFKSQMPGNLQFKVALNNHQNASQEHYYQPNSQEMNEDSYCSEEECDNDSVSLTN
jgi:hypothetical protein